MSDALTPLRHAYDVEPLGAPLAPGGAGHAEQEALGQLRAVLEDWPTPGPSPQAAAAVRARAAVVTAVLEQTDAAVVKAVASRRLQPSDDVLAAVRARAAVVTTVVAQTDAAIAQAVASCPQPRPSADVLAAVLARAAEPASGELPATSPVEVAIFDQSAQALDRLPRLRPDAAVIAAVEARAATASADLAPVRALYLDAPAVNTAEAVMLAQSRDAVERTLTSRPQPRPSTDAVAAVLARAAEASGVEPEPVLEVSSVEAAVFAQSLRALDRLPRHRPSAVTLDAVRLAAVTGGAAPVRDARPTPSPDRAPSRPSRRRTPIGLWAGAGTFLVAALALLVVFPFGGTAEMEPVTVAALAEADLVEPAQRASAADAALEEESAPEAPLPSSAASPLAGAAAMPGLLPAARQAIRQATPEPTASPAGARPQAAAPQVAARTQPARPTPSWDTPDDVRALSLRLQEIDDADALAWDDTPSETFGVPASPSAGAAAGFQAVREGTPARARFRSDSSSVQR